MAERAKGLGGSDAASYMGVGRGCKRRLYYEKTLTPPDFEDTFNPHTNAGIRLEPVIRAEYSRRVGRDVEVPTNSITSTERPYMLVHADGIVTDPFEYDGPGVLEIKSLADWSWNKFLEEGLYIGYQYQLQHAMYVTGHKWGSFAIHHRIGLEDQVSEWSGQTLLRPSDYEIKYWDVPADEKTQEMLVASADDFWSKKNEGIIPDPLPVGDNRCKECLWRETCRIPETIEEFKKDITRCKRLSSYYRNRATAHEERLVTIQGLS